MSPPPGPPNPEDAAAKGRKAEPDERYADRVALQRLPPSVTTTASTARMPRIAASDPGQLIPAPSVAQKIPNDDSSKPTANLRVFSGTRVIGPRMSAPAATTITSAATAPSAASPTWFAAAPKVM